MPSRYFTSNTGLNPYFDDILRKIPHLGHSFIRPGNIRILSSSKIIQPFLVELDFVCNYTYLIIINCILFNIHT